MLNLIPASSIPGEFPIFYARDQVNMHIPIINKLAPCLFTFLSPLSDTSRSPPSPPSTLTFRPIHAHGHTFTNSSSRPQLLLHNATASTSYLHLPELGHASSSHRDEAYLLDNPSRALASDPLTIRTRSITIRRPRDRPPSILSWALSARRQPYYTGNTSHTWVAPDYADDDGDWEDVEIVGPDIRDRQTLMALAKMSSNAYVTPDGGEWWPVEGWNGTLPFGWEPDSDGLRGHVVRLGHVFELGMCVTYREQFSDPTNSTVIISIKGTSAGVFGVGGPTARNDKFNVSLFLGLLLDR